jgi:hypothetical protein
MWTYVYVFIAIAAVSIAAAVIVPARWALAPVAVLYTAFFVLGWAHALNSRYRGLRRLRRISSAADGQMSPRSTSAEGAEQPVFWSREVIIGLIGSVVWIGIMAWMIKDSFSR